MTRHRRQSLFRNPWVSALLLLALAVRGLIPDGYMPDDPRREGGKAVKLCHSAAGGHLASHADRKPAPPHDGSSDGDHQSICPFSALLAGAPLPALLTALKAVAPGDAAFRFAAFYPPLSLARPVLPPRGPPAVLL